MSKITELLGNGGVDFYHAVYAIESQLKAESKEWFGIGRDSFPGQELIRFKADQSLGFPGKSISSVNPRDDSGLDYDAFELFVTFMGLTGPNGALPMHYTELIQERLKQKDPSMREFFDIFNHRLVSLFYRAWEKYSFPCQFQRSVGLDDSFTYVLKQLTGQEEHLSLYYGGLFTKPIRSAELIALQLSHLLNARVEIDPLKGRWIHLAKDEQSRTVSEGMPYGQHAQLGRSAIVGSRVWDVSSMAVINIHSDPKTVKDLMPGRSGYLKMKAVINNFLEPVIQCRVQLNAKVRHFPGVSVDGKSQLGMSGILLAAKSRNDIETSVSFMLARQ